MYIIIADFKRVESGAEGGGAASLGRVLDEFDGIVPSLVSHLPVQLGEALSVVHIGAEVRRHQQELEVVDHVCVHEVHNWTLVVVEATELWVALYIAGSDTCKNH